MAAEADGGAARGRLDWAGERYGKGRIEGADPEEVDAAVAERLGQAERYERTPALSAALTAPRRTPR